MRWTFLIMICMLILAPVGCQREEEFTKVTNYVSQIEGIRMDIRSIDHHDSTLSVQMDIEDSVNGDHSSYHFLMPWYLTDPEGITWESSTLEVLKYESPDDSSILNKRALIIGFDGIDTLPESFSLTASIRPRFIVPSQSHSFMFDFEFKDIPTDGTVTAEHLYGLTADLRVRRDSPSVLAVIVRIKGSGELLQTIQSPATLKIQDGFGDSYVSTFSRNPVLDDMIWTQTFLFNECYSDASQIDLIYPVHINAVLPEKLEFEFYVIPNER